MSLGIDLGTSEICCATYDGQQVKVIYKSPAVLSLSRVGRLEHIDKDREDDPEAIRLVKRVVGCRHLPTLTREREKVPNLSIHYDDRLGYTTAIQLKGESFHPEQILASLLGRCRTEAEKILKKIDQCVITVPASFAATQQQAILDAARIAGLSARLIHEQIAAVVAHGEDAKKKGNALEGVILVFDAGAGTTEVSIVNISNYSYSVKSTKGDGHLGGEDFTRRLMDHFERTDNVFRSQCEDAKKALSAVPEDDTVVHIGDSRLSITPKGFLKLCSDLYKRMESLVTGALDGAPHDDISTIIFVGGASQQLGLREAVESAVMQRKDGSRKISLYDTKPTEVVARGAALLAADSTITVWDTLSQRLGVCINAGQPHWILGYESIPANDFKDVQVPIGEDLELAVVESDYEAYVVLRTIVIKSISSGWLRIEFTVLKQFEPIEIEVSELRNNEQERDEVGESQKFKISRPARFTEEQIRGMQAIVGGLKRKAGTHTGVSKRQRN